MGKTRWILPVIIFLFFSLFGFGIAQSIGRSDLLASILSRQAPTSLAPTEHSNQQNFLIIHVDDLTGSHPRLVSVWVGLITFFEDQPFIHMKLLYPDPNSPYLREAIKNAFILDEQGKPSQAFTVEIQRFNIPWNGYILVDDVGASELIGALQLAPPSNPAVPTPEFLIPLSIDTPDASLALEPGWIQNLCLHLSQRNLNAPPFQKWSEVIPNHLRTDLTFDTLALTWERLTSSSRPTLCKIIHQ
jgi:hypothetical protein